MEDRKKEKCEEWFGNFLLRWEYDEYRCDVTAWEALSRDVRNLDGSHGCPIFLIDGWSCSPNDNTEDIEKAEKHLEGFVKWDGCSEFSFAHYHWCGANGYIDHIRLLRYIYERAHDLMGRVPETPWDESKPICT